MPPLVLSSAQRKRLRGLAHDFHPIVQVGRHGLTESFLAEVDAALTAHELIKLRFGAGKETKRAIAAEIEERLACACAGIVGHVAVLYRPHPEVEKRRIVLG